MNETVNHPAHYNQHPSKIECIDVVRWMNFNLGNAIKYIWRAGGKPGTDTVTDLKKAIWYLQDEISRLEEFHVREPESEQEVVREMPKQEADIDFEYYKDKWNRGMKWPPTVENAKILGVSIGTLNTWWSYMVAGEKQNARVD